VRFQCDAAEPGVSERTVQLAAGIDLQARFCGQHGQRPAVAWVLQFGNDAGFAAFAAIQHPVVVIALTEAQLWVRILDPFPDAPWLPKVERRVRDGGNLAGWNKGFIDRCVGIRVDA
jgi:hypothetical protein